MIVGETITKDEFLDKKRDYSPLLVHLTRDDELFSAKEVLTQILDQQTLRAYNHFCLFSKSLVESGDSELQNQFKVVCFTETPIDQIDILLADVWGRKIKLDSFGLVFKKDYIKKYGGNPVFYITKKIARPLWGIYDDEITNDVSKLLALVTLYDEKMDFHWEREWRIIGDFSFELTQVYCDLCPKDNIQEFENSYFPIKFISPHWGINKILDKLVSR